LRMTVVLVSLGSVIAAAVGWLLWLRRTWTLVTVCGQSMAPTFHDGQRLFARRTRRGHPYRPGDVVVFQLTARQREWNATSDPVHRVKRLAAVAGDEIPEWLREALGAMPSDRVPEGHVVIVGDNPGSEDSRHLGFVDTRSIVAVVHAFTVGSVQRGA